MCLGPVPGESLAAMSGMGRMHPGSISVTRMQSLLKSVAYRYFPSCPNRVECT